MSLVLSQQWVAEEADDSQGDLTLNFPHLKCVKQFSQLFSADSIEPGFKPRNLYFFKVYATDGSLFLFTILRHRDKLTYDILSFGNSGVRTSINQDARIVLSAIKRVFKAMPAADFFLHHIMREESYSDYEPFQFTVLPALYRSRSISDFVAFASQFEMFEIQYYFKHKVGVLLQREGQTTEEELYSNHEEQGSGVCARFNKFMSSIGERVPLHNFQGYAGSLDTMSNRSGSFTYYKQVEDHEILFHVCTLLPHKEADAQSVEKKRHIGNDNVLIIFQDSDKCTLDLSCIQTKVTLNIIVVQDTTPPEMCCCSDPKSGDKCVHSYRVSVAYKACGIPSSPRILQRMTRPEGIPGDAAFADWMLHKILNSVSACWKVTDMREKVMRHRHVLIEEFVKTLRKSPRKL